jgi:hypothetical protein
VELGLQERRKTREFFTNIEKRKASKKERKKERKLLGGDWTRNISQFNIHGAARFHFTASTWAHSHVR